MTPDGHARLPGGNFFLAFSKLETPLKSENFTALHNILKGDHCSGKRNGQVSWRKPIKNHLESLFKVSVKITACQQADFQMWLRSSNLDGKF